MEESLGTKTGERDHPGKGLDVGTQDPVVLLRRGQRGSKVEVSQPFLDIGQLEDASDLSTDLVQDGTRRPGRRQQ